MAEGTGTLYLCPTPIGNLEDVTLRLLRVLREADVVAAEDTRRTSQLLQHYEIRVPLLLSYHAHSNAARTDALLRHLREGKTVALVSDAGSPLISDPGESLVAACIAQGIPVVPLPGPSAVTTALMAAGLPTIPYRFMGFPPRQGGELRSWLQAVAGDAATLVLFESPHRLEETLQAAEEVLGDRTAVVARELSKRFETFHRGRLSELRDFFAREPVRGELTVLVAGARKAEQGRLQEEEVRRALAALLDRGLAPTEAAREVAREGGWSRREVYRLLPQVQRDAFLAEDAPGEESAD